MIYARYTLIDDRPGALPLELDGMFMPVTIVGPQSQEATTAQVDTGSSITGVDQTLDVGAQPVSTLTVETPLGQGPATLYSAEVQTGSLALTAGLPGVLGETLPPPVQALIGRDVLASVKITYTGPAGQWEMSSAAVTSTTTNVYLAAAGVAAIAAGVLIGFLGERHEEVAHSRLAHRRAA